MTCLPNLSCQDVSWFDKHVCRGVSRSCSLFAHGCSGCHAPSEDQTSGGKKMKNEQRDLGVATEDSAGTVCLSVCLHFSSSCAFDLSISPQAESQPWRFWARERFRSLTASEWYPSGKKRGGKRCIKKPAWKIELCGKARGEMGVSACRWIKRYFIWGAVRRLNDKCNSFISHSSGADPPLPYIHLYDVDL